MLRSWLANGLLLSVSIVFTIVLLELALAAGGFQKLYQFQQGLFVPSVDFGYTLAPNAKKTHSQPDYSVTITANSHGFRGSEPDFTAKRRILVLGDSFGMGQGVPDDRNLCETARRRFHGRGEDVEIFNTSISGYSGINHTGILRTYLPKYRPHLVILLFCWNDVGAAASLQVKNGYLVLRKDSSLSGILREWLNNHSRIYCLIKKAWFAARSDSVDPASHDGSYSATALAQTAACIGAMRDMSESAGAQFLLVIVPFKGVWDGGPALQSSKRQLAAMLRERKVAFEDLMDHLPSGDLKGYVLGTDLHWNEKGHAHFAGVLEQMIRRRPETAQNTTHDLQ